VTSLIYTDLLQRFIGLSMHQVSLARVLKTIVFLCLSLPWFIGGGTAFAGSFEEGLAAFEKKIIQLLSTGIVLPQ